MEESDFIRAVLADPKDDALLLVYSDWLEEQGDPAFAAKAEFLRLTAATDDDKTRGQRLQVLAATLDVDWLAVVSRLQLEHCPKKPLRQFRSATPLAFEFVCDRKWQDLRPTDEVAVRYCDGCEKNVHYCDTITQAQQQAAQGHCVAVDLGVIRRDGDLGADVLAEAEIRLFNVMGLLRPPSPEALDLLKPDAVSAERERRKREGGKQD